MFARLVRYAEGERFESTNASLHQLTNEQVLASVEEVCKTKKGQSVKPFAFQELGTRVHTGGRKPNETLSAAASKRIHAIASDVYFNNFKAASNIPLKHLADIRKRISDEIIEGLASFHSDGRHATIALRLLAVGYFECHLWEQQILPRNKVAIKEKIQRNLGVIGVHSAEIGDRITQDLAKTITAMRLKLAEFLDQVLKVGDYMSRWLVGADPKVVAFRDTNDFDEDDADEDSSNGSYESKTHCFAQRKARCKEVHKVIADLFKGFITEAE